MIEHYHNSDHFGVGRRIDTLLETLHAQSDAQDAELARYFSELTSDESIKREFGDRTNDFLRDKLVALDRSKAQFCYQVCRAVGARRIVEAGTSFGVSTIYLAAAVRDNTRGEQRRDAARPGPVVIGTESEPEKVRAARRNFAVAGLSDLIELREGDLRETLRDVQGPIDFMLIDIWVPMARPALELVAPLLRPGAVVVADNTQQFREAYGEYLAFVRDERNGFSTMTLPFDGGLEFSVRVG